MRKGIRTMMLALTSLIILLVAEAAPISSHGYYSGNQQYGAASCHQSSNDLRVTLASSPAAGAVMVPGQNVSIWVNVSGQIPTNVIGALIASTTGASGSLPTENGWTIVADPGGQGTQYNYFKMTNYSGNASFKWRLVAPSVSGQHHIYALVLYALIGNPYDKSAGPLIFDLESPGSVFEDMLWTAAAGSATIITICIVVLVFVLHRRRWAHGGGT